MTVDDEDRIVFEFLSDKNLQTDSDYDALDAKFSQIIALNGLILSIILFSADKAKCGQIFWIGIICIFISIIIGIYNYCPKDFEDGLDYFCQKTRQPKKITTPPTLNNIKEFNKL
ncbi:MAG: hypothetical protein NTZ37_07655, partial [Methanoregula sp.]|nr:hypothetical protein [Methanoregula sp.]